MPEVKIISNPYEKKISYQEWNPASSEWDKVTSETHGSSALLNKDLSTGFFPFQVKKIVDVLLSEYSSDEEPLTICFEGTADEYDELQDVCKLDEYSNKVLSRQTNVELANARDILPKVIALFQEMSPLIARSVGNTSDNFAKVQKDLNRFTDASSDVVPICVLGNYSTGKSTFINSLIGSEILPSGSEPVTAKIYKISKSKHSDRACIRCQYGSSNITIQFSGNVASIKESSVGIPLTSLIRASLSEISDEDKTVQINKILNIINDYEESSPEVAISDLIEIEIPFVNGILAHSPHPFVLFDTPGSNSASNARHLQVLKQAMANMTNGLPIFLSTPDSLDSTDNENLYHIIRDFEELDNRFTMIVVNKADSAGIQRRGSSPLEQNRILAQAVPRNLYSGGLFYVSSVLGLGSKNDGIFLDYVYEDIYDAQVARYQDPQNKHYRMLYCYNIMPEQLKLRADKTAAEESNKVYANSGLFTIEKEIETFAGKYSAYNKCVQSQLFLRRVIKTTSEEIESERIGCEGIRSDIDSKLDADKKALQDSLRQAAEDLKASFIDAYEKFMQNLLEKFPSTFSYEIMKAKEKEFISEQEELQNYSEYADSVKKAWYSVTFSDLFAGIGSVMDTRKERADARHDIEKVAADSLLAFVAQHHESTLHTAYTTLQENSKNYWREHTEFLRSQLIKIVSGSDVLTEDRRRELESIIVEYQQVSFDESAKQAIFKRENFERYLRIAGQVIWKSDHLDLRKLTYKYNDTMEKGLARFDHEIERSHKESSFAWISSLLDEITNNIVEYSPELSKQADKVRLMTRQIESLILQQKKLEDYTEQLSALMDWNARSSSL